MAALVLGSVGAALGASFLPATVGLGFGISMTGQSIGWLVGSTIGGFLGQPTTHQRQPGIGDKAVQASTYGAFQTIVYGTFRVAGNVIDGVSQIREVEHTTHVGKGGGRNTSTTLTWNCDIAIDLCQAGAFGIRKIWSSGKLVYDVSAGGTAASIIASSVNAGSFKLYDGNAAQLADPTLEAVHGVGNVPAYRGRSYAVFSALDCPNGQIPQLHFEVCMSISLAATLPIFTPQQVFHPTTATQAPAYTTNTSVCGPDVVYHSTQNVDVSNNWNAQGFRAGNGYSQKLWSVTWPSLGTGSYGRMPGMNGSHKTPMAVRAALGLNGTYTTANTMRAINLLTGAETLVRTFVPGTVDYDMVPAFAAYDEITARFVVMGLPTGGVNYERFNPGIYTLAAGLQVRLALPATAGMPMAFYNGIVYTLDQRGGVTYLQRYDGSTGAFISEVAGGPGTISCAGESATTGADPISGSPIVGFDTAISAHAGGVFVYAKTLASAWRVDTAWTLLSSTIAASTSAAGIQNAWVEQDYVCEGPLVAAPDAALHYRVAAMKSFDPQDVSVGSVINDLCTRSGLTTGQINTAAQVATLRGYAITGQASARAAIEPLLKAFFIDAREEDGKVVFVNRADQVSAFTVAYTELDASQGTPSGDLLPLSHAEQLQMPHSVTVTYVDPAADYLTNSARAIRQTATIINEQQDQLPMAITATQAATAADVLLYDAWSQRNKRTAKTSRKFAAVSPGDVGTFEYPQGTFKLKRVTSVSDDGAVVSMDLVDGDAPLYSATIPGAAQGAQQSGLTLLVPTRMAIMDLPILRDVDNNNGVYVALSSYATPGTADATLYIGADDSTLAIAGSVSTGTSVGFASTALADWPNNTPDTVNTVRVEEVGAQASTTLDTALNSGDGLWLIGDELVQAVTVTFVSTGVYDLSTLVRARRGTERYKSTHVAGERAVRVPIAGTGILRPVLDVSVIGQVRQYRAITNGMLLDSMPSVPFTLAGNALKPLSPVDFKRVALNGNNVLTWNRRSRYSGEFPDGADIALGENAEQYIVDVFADASFALVVRSISSVTPAATYTLAQQVTDFGSYQGTLYLRIYQLSALVGRGVKLEVTSTLANLNSTPPSLLAHMDGAGVVSAPLDSSAYAFASVLAGAAALSTVQSRFSGSSLYIPDTTSFCYFDTVAAAHSLGSGDFTVEFFFYTSSTSSNSACISLSDTGVIGSVAQTALYVAINQATQVITLQTYAGGASDALVSTGTGVYATGVWNHVAVSRRSGTARIFVNGVQQASVASAGALHYTSSNKVIVGGWNTTSLAATYIDEVRITKGEAIYFADFTPPALPF